MNLQWALLALGVILVLIVFTISRFGSVFKDSGDQPAPRKQGNRQSGILQNGQEQANSIRDANNAPSFDDEPMEALDKEDQFDVPLFDYSEQDEAEQTDSSESNVLLSEELLEPDEIEASAAPATSAPSQANNAENIEAVEAEIESIDEPESETSAVQAPFSQLRQIDYWAKVVPSSARSQLEIMAELDNLIDQTAFPVQAHALTDSDGRWLDLLSTAMDENQNETKFKEMVISYQLLHKSKASSLNALYDFEERLSVLCYSLEAKKLAMGTPEQAHEQSLKLEQMYTESYAPVAVCISAPKGQAFMGKLVETSAKQQGLDFVNGEYLRQKRMGNKTIILYRMVNDDLLGFSADSSADTVIKRVTFSMVPALSKTPGRDVKEMLDSSKAFSSRVHGEIRIPGHESYHQDQLLKIRDRVSKIEKKLIEAGLNPGSDEAKRLFA